MLTRLSIRNIVLIEALDLDFSGGLGVLTGETGAGKSILLDALGLVLGNRADTGLVRAGADRASVSASFEFRQFPQELNAVMDEADIETEPGEALVIRRTLKADGGSKAFINDQPVSNTMLRSLAPFLVEIHGQHDDRGLINPRGHMALLDRYIGADQSAISGLWRQWQDAEKRLQEARETLDAAREEQDLLLAHLSELNELAPQSGEEVRLAEIRATMQKGEKLSGELDGLRHLFEGSESPLAGLRVAARRLERIAEEAPQLGEALAALDRAVVETAEAEAHLEAAAEALLHNPEELERAETRLFDLRAAARKHRCEVDALPKKTRELRAQLDAIEGGEAELDVLTQAASETRDRYIIAAEELHARRVDGAEALDKAVKKELAPLKLDAARFKTEVEALPSEQWGATGMDRVEFMIATNPGADFAPLRKIASGGELSRFILALKVALAEQGGAASMIFDEIDRGVGGAVASAIGERLMRLADGGQLLAVTHSPQVAARGALHFKIDKSSEGTVTRTSVSALDQDHRQEEIARMLSGAEITDEARAQAQKLLEGA